MAELGAEVIKLQRREGGDCLRGLLPQAYRQIDPGKKSVAVDLKSRGEEALFEDMAMGYDVVVEPSAPASLGSMGSTTNRSQREIPLWCTSRSPAIAKPAQ